MVKPQSSFVDHTKTRKLHNSPIIDGLRRAVKRDRNLNRSRLDFVCLRRTFHHLGAGFSPFSSLTKTRNTIKQTKSRVSARFLGRGKAAALALGQKCTNCISDRQLGCCWERRITCYVLGEEKPRAEPRQSERVWVSMLSSELRWRKKTFRIAREDKRNFSFNHHTAQQFIKNVFFSLIYWLFLFAHGAEACRWSEFGIGNPICPRRSGLSIKLFRHVLVGVMWSEARGNSRFDGKADQMRFGVWVWSGFRFIDFVLVEYFGEVRKLWKKKNLTTAEFFRWWYFG